MRWKVYTPARIADENGVFNPDQLYSRKKNGFLPAITAKPNALTATIAKELAEYLQNEEVESVVFHGSGDIYGNEERVKKSIDFCRNLNDEWGPFVKKIVFKAGSLHSQKGDREKRNNYELFNGSIPCFDAGEYLKFWEEEIKDAVDDAVDYAGDDLELLVRTVHTEIYATTEHLPEAKESEYDRRWSGTGWLANPVNQGDVGTILDVDKLTRGGIAASIDRMLMTEHLSMIRNFKTMGEPRNLDSHQEEVLERFGIYIPNGGSGPVIFREPVCAMDKIKEWGDRVKIAYLSGCLGTGMHFRDRMGDKKVYRIASMKPILNGKDADPSKFIEDKAVREELRGKSMEILKKSKRTLENAGCKEAVINTHLGKGVYDGPIWNYYNGISLKNFTLL